MIPIFILRNSILYLSIIIGLLLLGIVIFNATWIMMPIKKLKLAADAFRGETMAKPSHCVNRTRLVIW
jgi:hypothetical protein